MKNYKGTYKGCESNCSVYEHEDKILVDVSPCWIELSPSDALAFGREIVTLATKKIEAQNALLNGEAK